MTAVAGILLCATVCVNARAADPFTLTASGGGTDITANGTNLIDLTDHLINSEDQFAALAGQSLVAFRQWQQDVRTASNGQRSRGRSETWSQNPFSGHN